MHSLSSHEVTVFLLVIGIMLILARLLYKIGKPIGLPPLVSEIIAGIILGPTVLAYFFPATYLILFPEEGGLQGAYDTITNLSVVMLLFLAGMELDFDLLKKKYKEIAITSTFAILVPFLISVWAGWKFFSFFHGFTFSAAPFVFPLTFGTIIAISSLPILISILLSSNLFHTQLGVTILGTAFVTDIVGWLLFASILIYANPSIPNSEIFFTILYVIIYFILMYIVTSYKTAMASIFARENKGGKEMTYDISMLLGTCLLSGAFTNAIEIHPSIGAFMAGIICRRIIGENIYIFNQLETFILNFFAPIFFISIGLKLNFYTQLNVPMTLAVFFLACITKIAGSYLGAYISGYQFRMSMIAAVCLNARGSMEILMGAVALKIGLIGTQLFVTFVIVAIATSLMAIPIINRLLIDLPEVKPTKE